MIFFTNNQIEPSASPDNLLHPVLVNCGKAKSEEKDGDVVHLIADVQVNSFRNISIHYSKQIKSAYYVRFVLIIIFQLNIQLYFNY